MARLTMPLFPPRERLILRLVDSLHETNTIHETLWAALKTEFSDEQLIELVVLTGFYHTISFVTNALAVPLEGNAARFATYQPSSASNAS